MFASISLVLLSSAAKADFHASALASKFYSINMEDLFYDGLMDALQPRSSTLYEQFDASAYDTDDESEELLQVLRIALETLGKFDISLQELLAIYPTADVWMQTYAPSDAGDPKSHFVVVFLDPNAPRFGFDFDDPYADFYDEIYDDYGDDADVPEPAMVFLWALGGVGALSAYYKKSQQRQKVKNNIEK